MERSTNAVAIQSGRTLFQLNLVAHATDPQLDDYLTELVNNHRSRTAILRA